MNIGKHAIDSVVVDVENCGFASVCVCCFCVSRFAESFDNDITDSINSFIMNYSALLTFQNQTQ